MGDTPKKVKEVTDDDKKKTGVAPVVKVMVPSFDAYTEGDELVDYLDRFDAYVAY